MKIYAVQYLRGAAAVMVVVAHAVLHPLPAVIPDVERLGSLGVLLFFVISGFIMVFTTGEGSFRAFDFMRRRVERIVPLYWMTTIAVALLAMLLPSLLKNTTFSVDRLVLSLLFVPHARENGELVPLMKLGWTLNYEMFFYLIFAAFSMLSAIRRVSVVSLIFCALALLGATVRIENDIAFFYTRSVILVFCLGMFVGLWVQRWRVRLSGKRTTLALSCAAAALIAGGFLYERGAPISPGTDAFFSLGCAMLLLAGIALEPRMPRWKVLILIGDSSYVAYLVHMYVVAATIVVFQRIAPDIFILVPILVALTASLMAAIAIHVVIERPILRCFHVARAVREPSAP